MILAVTYENGQIFQHFGHTQAFKLYQIEDGRVVSSTVVSTNGKGHSALAAYLKLSGAEALLCGGIGGGAVNALNAMGITLYCGVTGDADKAVDDYIHGCLQYSSVANCDHHHGQSCEEHDCGEDSCYKS